MPAPRVYRLVFRVLAPATVDDLPLDIRTALALTGFRPKPYEPLVVELDGKHALRVLGIILEQMQADTE